MEEESNPTNMIVNYEEGLGETFSGDPASEEEVALEQIQPSPTSEPLPAKQAAESKNGRSNNFKLMVFATVSGVLLALIVYAQARTLREEKEC